MLLGRRGQIDTHDKDYDDEDEDEDEDGDEDESYTVETYSC